MGKVSAEFPQLETAHAKCQMRRGASCVFLIPDSWVPCSDVPFILSPSVSNRTAGSAPVPQHHPLSTSAPPSPSQHIPAAPLAAVAGQDMLDPVPVPSEGAVSYFIMRFSRSRAPAGGNVGTGWSAERTGFAGPLEPARTGPMTFDCSNVRLVFCFPSLACSLFRPNKNRRPSTQGSSSPIPPSFPKFPRKISKKIKGPVAAVLPLALRPPSLPLFPLPPRKTHPSR